MPLVELVCEATINLLVRTTRSALAAIGIICGVASVICMLSISEVARRDVVKRIEKLGANNIIIDSVKPELVRGREQAESNDSWLAQYGINRTDLEILCNNVDAISGITPMRIMLQGMVANQRRTDTTVVGTTANYPVIMQHGIAKGRFFNKIDEINLRPVCVLGFETARSIFPLKSPVGQVVKIGNHLFTVIGVLQRHGPTGSGGKFSDPDGSAFIPFDTTFARFGGFQYKVTGNTQEVTRVEVDRVVLRVDESAQLNPIAQIATNLLLKRHRRKDFSVLLPHRLLAEKRESEQIFRWVMASLAAISLLVGGIGIMNIMLANVTERRSEIGLRRALGATKGNIVALFVTESLMLSVIGGLFGVGFGMGLANLIGTLAQWTVVYHPWSIPLGILVSLLVGLIFGTAPAIRAANQDPVLALRTE